MKIKLIKVLFFGFCILIIAGVCVFANEATVGSNPLSGLAVKPDGTPYHLGMIANEMRSGWMTSYIGYQKSIWERAGGKFTFFVSEYDMNLEISQMDDLIQLRPDAILVHPSDSHAIASAVEKAKEQGYPVFAVDVGVIGAPVESFVHINQEDLGRKIGEAVEEAFSADNPAIVLEMAGGLEQDIIIKRRDGFHNYVKNIPYIKIVQTIDTRFSNEIAFNGVMDALEKNPDINCIYSHGDMWVTGILQGLDIKNKLIPVGEKGHIFVGSIDADAVGLKGIREGYIDADSEHNPLLHAVVITNIILAKLHGHDIPEEVILNPTLVTKKNVDSIERWGKLPSGEFDSWPVVEQDFFNFNQ